MIAEREGVATPASSPTTLDIDHIPQDNDCASKTLSAEDLHGRLRKAGE
jgi:hypothetical protein